MSWRLEGSVSVSCSARDFYSGVAVWLERPNVVNKRLLGAVTHFQTDYLKLVHLADAKVKEVGVTTPGCTKGGTVDRRETDSVVYKQPENKQIDSIVLSELLQVSRLVTEESVTGAPFNGKCLIRELLPKMRNMPQSLEAVIINEDHHSLTFCPLFGKVSLSFPIGSYRLQCSHQSDDDMDYICSPFSNVSNGVTAPTIDWLKSVLLPKIALWSEESALHQYSSRCEPLVPLSRYSQLYRSLKEKYGKPLVKNWPEATDPHKFVYEDIAIATYLLVLWELERIKLGLEKKQSFIDLGCGNGLLVYLLSAEGHPGKGIDLRERKIWKMYGNKAKLEVCTLTPSDETLFPGFDWLLGNHSDELTPWIPVMAARSSYQTRYFVLPCCPHDFENKFCRPGADKSQYRSYLDYVREIGETMGFKVQEDIMRIPSTKRVCQIGGSRSYLMSKENEIIETRKAYLDRKCPSRASNNSSALASSVNPLSGPESAGKMPPALGSTTQADESNAELISIEAREHTKWAVGFQPRSSIEHSRNCSLIDFSLKMLVIEILTSKLLETENYVCVRPLTRVESIEGDKDGVEVLSHEHVTKTELVPLGDKNKPMLHESKRGIEGANATECQQDKLERPTEWYWNRGGRINLNTAARLLNASDLKELKKEYGGLQTLLRNEHQVFKGVSALELRAGFKPVTNHLNPVRTTNTFFKLVCKPVRAKPGR